MRAAEGDAANGKKVFASAGCGGCHTFSAAGSTGTVGPNLDDANVDVDAVVQQVKNGGGGMPAFGISLSDQEIADVAAFVDAVAVSLPDDFPRDVAAFACDLDRTLIAEDAALHPRTLAALRAVRDAGLPS